MTDLPLSRRAVTRAILAAPAAFAIPSATAATAISYAASSEWEAVVSAEQAARAEMDARYDSIVRPANQAHDEGRVTFDDVRAAEDAWTNFVDARHDAIDRLMQTPAPSIEAVAYKMEVAHHAEMFCDFDKAGPAILADLRRLTGSI